MKPLHGIRILELEAIGPVPWASMLLADMGADVVRIVRPDHFPTQRPTLRGRTVISLNLKTEEDLNVAKRLIASTDVLLDGMRPGALDRLNLTSEICFALNSRLVIGRMTGWGQEGPLAHRAGHDINYIALSGALHAIGEERPILPLNLIGDYGGGGAFLLIGVLAALIRAKATGVGEIVDAAMVDGASCLMTMVYERMMDDRWVDRRRSNEFDGAAPWYDVYETLDRKFVAIGCIEPQFYEEFISILGLDLKLLPDRADRANWDNLRKIFADLISKHTRQYWTKTFENTDACVTPVLSLLEAPHHPHLAARKTFYTQYNHQVPRSAPRFGKAIPQPSLPATTVTPDVVLSRWSSASSLQDESYS